MRNPSIASLSLKALPWIVGTTCLTATAAGVFALSVDNSVRHTIEFAVVGGTLSATFAAFAVVQSPQRVVRNVLAGSLIGLTVFVGGLTVRQEIAETRSMHSPFTPE